LASLIVGASSLNDIKKIGKIGGKTFAFFIITTILAITIGLGLANLVEPGKKVSKAAKEQLLSDFSANSSKISTDNLNVDVIDFVVNIIPKNPINAITSGDMLQIVFFAVMFGITLTFVDKTLSKPVIDFFTGMSETMIKMVDIIMKLAPIGVFALIANTISDFGFGILQTLIWYCFVVVAGLFIHTTLVYGSIVKIWGKMNPLHFFNGMRNA
jgi:Na+/H+-dicarboxylate symporter